MAEQSIFLIDIEETLKSKAPRRIKNIPKFVINWLKTLIYQEELNDFLRVNNGAEGIDFMTNAVKYFDIKIQTKGLENIPQDKKKYIFVSNHPLGGLDGICLSALLGEMYKGKIKYLVNDILYFIKPLHNIFVPINKHGAQSRKTALAINEAFESGNQIITFPAGFCSRKIKGKIVDLEWKKMFIVKSTESQRDVIPIYFEARNSNFFYSLANIRKFLGIKFNIEMLFLPREMFKNKGRSFIIHFGRPICWETFDSSKNAAQWAQEVKRLVYGLKN